MKRFEIEAKPENLIKVNEFIDAQLADCPWKLQMQIGLVVEEIFVNIAKYAYGESGGNAVIGCELADGVITLVFEDSGMPFDPLKREEPDVNAPAEEREIGGLGIFLSKKLTDNITYEYANGKNILTIIKNVNE